MRNPKISVASEFAELADDDLITIPEYARFKNIGLNTAKRMVYRGELPVVRLSPRRMAVRMGVARRWQYEPAAVAA